MYLFGGPSAFIPRRGAFRRFDDFSIGSPEIRIRSCLDRSFSAGAECDLAWRSRTGNRSASNVGVEGLRVRSGFAGGHGRSADRVWPYKVDCWSIGGLPFCKGIPSVIIGVCFVADVGDQTSHCQLRGREVTAPSVTHRVLAD